MGALAGKLSDDLPPRYTVGPGKKLDRLDPDDQAAIIALHVEHGYMAAQIAAIVTANGFSVNEYTMRTWLRERGVYRS